MAIVDCCCYLLLLLLVIIIIIIIIIRYRAYSYRREFLTFDGFDNYFITKTLQKMDTKRELRKLPTIFPLIKYEIIEYVNACKYTALSLSSPVSIQTQRKRLRLNGNRASLYVFFCNIVPVGLPACLIQRLQSAKMPQHGSSTDWDALNTLLSHWSAFTGCVFKSESLSELSFWCIEHWTAQPYLASQCTRVADMPTRRRRHRAIHSSVNGWRRVFPVAGANIWNCLPIQTSPQPPLPCLWLFLNKRLKTFLFHRCYDIIMHPTRREGAF